VCLVRMKRERYLWIVLAPMAWLVVCTLTAGWQKIFASDAKLGFLAHARRYADALARNELLAPAKSVAEMQSIVNNDRIDAALAGAFMLLVVAMIGFGLRAALAARRSTAPTAHEAPWISIAEASR